MRRTARIATTALVAVISLGLAHAQPPGDSGSLQFRMGGFFPEGDSGFWEENRAVFGSGASDFDGVMFGASWVMSMGNRLELGLNADWYSETTVSSYLDYVDEDGFDILHDSRLEMVPLTADLRFLPFGRYAVRGSHGQVSVRRPVPYLGFGAGMNFWSYEEIGDFLSFDADPPLVVFGDFEDSGVAFETHVLAGIELPVGPVWSLMFEGRYSWADDELGESFAGLGTIDLGGASAFIGASMRF